LQFRTLTNPADLYACNRRQGTVKTKTRSDSADSRKKLGKK